METISNILFLFFCLTFMATLVGMIRPAFVVRWGKKRTRRRVLLYYGLATIVLMFLGAAVHSKHKAPEYLERGTKLLSVARKAYDSQDYSTAIDSVNEATQALNRAKGNFPEAAVLADQAQDLLDSAKKARAQDLERGTKLLSVARKAYDSQDYSTAIDSVNEATQALNRAKGNFPEAAVLADQAQDLLDSAKKARAQTEARGHLERGTRLLSVARRAYDSQDYSTAVDSAEKATQILNRVKDDLREAAILADQAQAFLNSAKETLLEDLAIPQVSTHQLFREYDRNEVAAKIKYEGEIVIITGTIRDIRTTFITDDPYIVLAGPGGGGLFSSGNITCYFSEGEESSIAKVSKGQRVKIRGKVSGLSMGDILVRGCKLQ